MSDKPSTILFFSSFGNLRWGGQKSLYLLVRNIDRTLFSPLVSLPDEGEFAEQLHLDGIPFVVVPLTPLRLIRVIEIFKSVLRIKKIIQDHGVRLIHTDGPRNTFYAGLAAKLTQVPLVWHIRDSTRDFLDRFLFLLSSNIILVSKVLQKRFNWTTSNEKFITIYNGVNLKSFQQRQDDVLTLRTRYRVNENSFVIGVVGRVEPLKGQLFLIEACGLIKDKLPDFHLIIAGEVTDSEYAKACLNMADDLGIRDRVQFLGYQDDIPGILSFLDLFVLPSLREAFPRSVIEAMAMGKPVIVTSIGGSPESIESSVSGYVVPPGDPRALADYILLIGIDKELRLRMGEAARARAHRMFSLENNVRQTENVYREILNRQIKRVPTDE